MLSLIPHPLPVPYVFIDTLGVFRPFGVQKSNQTLITLIIS